MSHVVFLRAANVGGNSVFRPAQLAIALKHLDVVNVGAAGTFVVREKAPAAVIKSEILSRLPFEPALVVRPAREILALVDSAPFRGVRFSRDLRGWVAVLSERPKTPPRLPVVKPAGKLWSVRFERLQGAFAMGLQQRRPGRSLYASNVVEDALGVPATTRWWETIERIANILSA